MKRLLLLLACAATFPLAAAAQETHAAARARAALDALDAATLQLDEANTARDRVRALTATIQAFEEGLGAMREGLRQVAIRERVLADRLSAKDQEVATLLAALLTVGRTDAPTIFLHPQGVAGSARASLLLTEVGPALNTRAEDLRRDLTELRTLGLLQQDAADRMAEGLAQIQAARAALNQAMAERVDLPRRFVADPEAVSLLIDGAETLEGFASGLSEMIVENTTDVIPEASRIEAGRVPLPVQGVVLRAAGETDAAGVSRPGLLLATRPGALVTSPVAATIRYTGPLLDFDQVAILEPQADVLIILAGMARTFGTAGEVIPAETPVGLMGGAIHTSAELMSPVGEGTGTDRTETLYIEIREQNRPVAPDDWFTMGTDE